MKLSAIVSSRNVLKKLIIILSILNFVGCKTPNKSPDNGGEASLSSSPESDQTKATLERVVENNIQNLRFIHMNPKMINASEANKKFFLMNVKFDDDTFIDFFPHKVVSLSDNRVEIHGLKSNSGKTTDTFISADMVSSNPFDIRVIDFSKMTWSSPLTSQKYKISKISFSNARFNFQTYSDEPYLKLIEFANLVSAQAKVSQDRIVSADIVDIAKDNFLYFQWLFAARDYFTESSLINKNLNLIKVEFEDGTNLEFLPLKVIQIDSELMEIHGLKSDSGKSNGSFVFADPDLKYPFDIRRLRMSSPVEWSNPAIENSSYRVTSVTRTKPRFNFQNSSDRTFVNLIDAALLAKKYLK